MAEIVEPREPVDMSAAAVAQRLRDLQQLFLFSMSLTHARFVDQVPPTAEAHPPAGAANWIPSTAKGKDGE